MLSLLPGAARADIVTGSVELYDQNGTNTTRDAAGQTSESRSKSLLQRYTLNYNNMVLPTINLWGRMRVERQVTNSETDGISGKSTDALFAPSGGLAYLTPFVVAGISIDEIDDKQGSGEGAVTLIRETKNAFLGFKPEGLPSLDLQYTELRRYDREHVNTDIDDKLYTLRSMYRPVKGVQLFYNALYDDNQNNITQGETKTGTQSGKVSYGDRFIDNRLLLGADYNISQQNIQTVRSSISGAILLQRFANNGLSSVSIDPVQTSLDVNLALTDGNLLSGSGINLGSSAPAGIQIRQVGADFGIPTEVSTLYVWVDRALPPVISNIFTWDVYISQDNQSWSLYQQAASAVFGLFDNRFEITVPPVQARYIKAVTRPLTVAVVAPPGVDVSNLFITEIQAFDAQSHTVAAGRETTTVQSTESVNLNGRMDLIRSERHSLQYSVYYQEQKNDQTDQALQRQSTLSNALIGLTRLSRIFTGTGKILAQNSDDINGNRTTYYDYEAALAAEGNSLRKLFHTMLLIGKREEWFQTNAPTIMRESGTFSLSNAGEVYPGINAYLQGVENIATTMTDTSTGHSDSAVVSAGVDIVPHRGVTISLISDWSEGHQPNVNPILSGSNSNPPNLATTASRRKSQGVNASYNPLSSLYLYGSYLHVVELNKPTVTYTYYSVSWSTQQSGGALEIRLNYTENYEIDSQTRIRSYGPYVKWKINSKTFLDAQYAITTTEDPTQKITANTFTSSLKAYF